MLEDRARNPRRTASSIVVVFVPIYAFVACWLCMRHFSLSNLMPDYSSPWIQLLQSFLFESLVGLFLPATVLTLPIILSAWLRTPVLWVCVSLAAGLVTSTAAQVYAVPPDAHFTQAWGFVIGIIVRLPFVATWAVALYCLVSIRTLTGPKECWPRFL